MSTNNIAAPLVEGLFPQNDDGDALGESVLLFTLGVTNAGKTHTVMGTGFETKGEKKKKKPMQTNTDSTQDRFSSQVTQK